MSDLDFQNLSTVQSDKQPTPKNIASIATIEPTTFLTTLTGTTSITNIVPPVEGTHLLMFISNAATPFAATGNITAAFTMAAATPAFAVYNPISGQYTIGEIVVT